MQKIIVLFARCWIPCTLGLVLCAPVFAAPNKLLLPKMDTVTQSRVATAETIKPAATATIPTTENSKPAKTDKCTSQCAAAGSRTAFFGLFFDVFDGRPVRMKGDSAENVDDNDRYAPGKPPRIF